MYELGIAYLVIGSFISGVVLGQTKHFGIAAVTLLLWPIILYRLLKRKL